MKNKFTVLVNSSDGFEDCWSPFFILLKKYWSDLDQPIMLNTEFKTCLFDGLKIICSKAHNGVLDRKLSWSECLINAINKIETPLILYMQEDYFIEKPVLNNLVNEFAANMISDKEIKYIGLTDIGNRGPFSLYDRDDRLSIVGNGKYRISTQAALWRKETLLSYLKPEENGWMFEIFGSQRSNRRGELFLTANRGMFSRDNNPIITYEHTGIIKGQWHNAMPALFYKEKIEIDFSDRGIYIPKPVILRKIETGKKLLKSPFTFIKGMLGK
jgi:hypothetical protein